MADNLDLLMEDLRNPQPQAQPQEAPAPAVPKVASESTLGSVITGIGDAATSGFLDEGSGLLETLGVTAGTNATSMWSSGKSFSDTLASNIAMERSQMAADDRDHFWATNAGRVGGALLVPAGSGAKGALQVAKIGALQGAAYGAGSGEGLGDRAAKAGEGFVAGGLISAALHALINGASALVGKVFGKGTKEAVETEANKAAVDAGESSAPTGGGLAVEVTDDGLPGMTPEGAGPSDIPAPNPADITPGVPQAPATGWTTPAAQGNRQAISTVEHLAPTAEGDALIPLHSNPTPELPNGEAMGSISRAGLSDLQAQVAHFTENVGKSDGRAVDITPASPEHPTLGAFRLGNLGDTPDTMSLLGALVRQLPAAAPKTDAEMFKVAAQGARDIGTNDPEALSALAQQMAGPGGNLEGSIALLRTVQRQAADTVTAFHGAGVDWSTASDDMVKEVGQAIFNVQSINSLVQSAKVGVGRALRVFSLPNSEAYFAHIAAGTTATPAAERSIPALPSTREEMQGFMELLGMAKGNPAIQSDLLQGTLTVPTGSHYLTNSFANLFTASILSAPKTALLNVVGPTFLNSLRAMEKMSGAAVLALDPTISAAQRADYMATAKYTPMALYHTMGDIADAFRYGVKSFKENHTVIGGGGSVADANVSFGPYNSHLLKAAGADPNWQYTLGNVLNIFPKAYARVNAGLDEMAKRLTYMNETRLRAMVDASGQGLEGDAFHAAVSATMRASVDEVGAATNKGIMDAAERTTLTGQVGSDGNLARKFATGIQTLRHDYPLMRFMLPVFNVPANGLGETLKRIPGINTLSNMGQHVADLAGDNGVVAQAEAHGRTLLGGAFLSAGYLMNQAGVLTGAGPQNAKDNAIWRQTHEPYSIRVGDTWVSYRKLDVLGGLLSIPASISDASVYHKADQGEMANVLLAATAALATWFKDQASMRTATQLLTLGDNPAKDNGGKAIMSIVGQMSAGMIPGSGFIRTMGAETTDPYVRMKRSWTDYLKAGLPGLSQELEPLRNVLGEPINRPNNSIGEAVFPVSMAPVATFTHEPVLNELTRLYQATGYAAAADPRAVLFGYKDSKDVKLEDGVSLYSHLVQPRATMQLDGQTLKQALGELIDSPEYKEALDGTSSSVTSLGEQTRATMVQAVFYRYSSAIKAEVAAASPTALKYMTAAAAKHRDNAYLNTVPIDDLVANPDLYEANGIDPEQYSDKITSGAAGDLVDALNGGAGR